MAGMDWFRWHHGTVTDPKFQLIARKSGASVAEVVAVWAVVLEEASMCEARGSLGQFDFEAIDCALGLADGRAKAIHDLMADRGLIDLESGVVAKWNKRQPKRERDDDSSTERSRKHRAMQRQETPDAEKSGSCESATPCNAMQRQETPRGEERREEVNPLSEERAEGDSPRATLAGRVCARLRSAGIAQVNPSNPRLLKLIESGLAEGELADLAMEPGSKGKGFNWLLAAAEGRRRDAAAMGALPPARASPRTKTAAQEREEVSRALTGRGDGGSRTERDITGEVERVA